MPERTIDQTLTYAERPVARLTNVQLASKMAWHTRRALNATGANKALYDARARLALRYWLRAHGHVLPAI